MALFTHKKNHYNWQTDSEFELLVDGHEFYPSMLKQIHLAKSSILIEQYLVKSSDIFNQFIDALVAARQRGVMVYMLLDHFGCNDIRQQEIDTLRSQGVHIHFFHPVNLASLYRSMQRDHRKIAIIDTQVAYIGGAGIHDENLGLKDKNNQMWHDVMVKMLGPIVNDCVDAFKTLWQSVSRQELDINFEPANKAGNDSGRLLLAGPGENNIIRSTINNISKDTAHIWIASPYFITTRKLRHHLKHAAKRGCDVRLLTPGPVTDHRWIRAAARRYYHRLLVNGVKIYEYQPRFIHSKIVLCDEWATIGSSNLDRWNQHWNLEANIAMRSDRINKQLFELFEKDFSQSELFTLKKWKSRPLLSRLTEWIAGYYIGMLQWMMLIFNKRDNN